MTDTSESTGRNSLGHAASPLLGPIRVAIGLLQGIALWWLHRTSDGAHLAWPATVPEVFAPLALILLFVPILLLAGVGRMRWITLAVWTLIAVAVLTLMGWHDIARQSADTLRHPPFVSFPMPLFAIVVLFIGHHLILPADLERKWIAPFPVYFDTAWKAGVQLALSGGFTGAFWVLLFLGAALFRVIGLTFLEDLIRETWFSIPVTTLAFSVAVHLTDVRDGLIRGVRTVALMLLSWLLLLMTVLAAGFVLALPFTGLKGLWDTGSATSLVLAAVAALIVLINTAYQDGRPDNLPPAVLRVAVRIASVLLIPLIVIAFWGLALRIGQHGLTPDRIIALACAVVGALHAVGYTWAALRTFWRKGDWMRPLEPTNIAGAILAVVLILALFSPLLDPARLSVADQVSRLDRGAVAPDRFDYRFLRFQSGDTGQAALVRLAASRNPEVARRAKEVQTLQDRWERPGTGAPRATPRFEMVPAGSALPAGFERTPSRSDERARCIEPGECVVTRLDIDGDGLPETLMARNRTISLWVQTAKGDWEKRAAWRLPACRGRSDRPDVREMMRRGEVRPVAPILPDLSIGDSRATLGMDDGCPPMESTP